MIERKVRDLRLSAKTRIACTVGLTSVLMIACGEEPFIPEAQVKPEALPEELDMARMVQDDLDGLNASLEGTFSPGQLSHADAFADLFGGLSAANVKKFVKERTGTVGSFENFLVVLRDRKTGQVRFIPHVDIEDTEVSGANLGMMAFTLGLAEDKDNEIWAGRQTLKVKNPRQGVIALPKNYYDMLHPHLSSRIRRWIRQETLIHEARHSDCGGGGFKRINQGELDFNKKISGDWRFGWTHSVCTTGAYKSRPVCDEGPWGANTAGYLFLKAVQTRPDLSVSERLTLATIFDDLGEKLAGFDVEAMVRGDLGPPDLSHTPDVAPDR